MSDKHPWTDLGTKHLCMHGYKKADDDMKILAPLPFRWLNLAASFFKTECAQICMKKVDASLLKTSTILGEISEERAKCLKDFIKCKSLVDWLKESMPGKLDFPQISFHN